MFGNIAFPSLFVCFLIFLAWLHYKKAKAQRKANRISNEFWQREDEANYTRNKDISHLPMYHIDRDSIPMMETDDENILFYQKQTLASLELPMMNLSEYTNTDLKLAYGVGNFKTLSDYDRNFNEFLMNMSNLGNAYFSAECFPESVAVYRLCLDSGCQKSTDFKALAKVYSTMKERGKLADLIKEVEHSDLPRKTTLVEELKQFY